MYYIKSTSFIKSIADIKVYIDDYNQDDHTTSNEICVVGRSNVGKSSFINLIAGRKGLAKTSSTPGRTRLINLFEFIVGDRQHKNTLLENDGKFTLVDLPGYGYAKAPKTEISKWGDLMQQYFEAAKANLKHVFSLVDIRHEPSELDVKMIKFLSFHGIPFTVIATKADKISNPQLAKHIQILATKLTMGKDNIIPTSTLNTKGKDATISRLAQILTKSDEVEEYS